MNSHENTEVDICRRGRFVPAAETMINVNGERSEWSPGKTVRDVIKEKNYLFPLLIARINGKLIPRDEYSSTVIPDNATVDIIHLMSGG